jgi:hypothetical protein
MAAIVNGMQSIRIGIKIGKQISLAFHHIATADRFQPIGIYSVQLIF